MKEKPEAERKKEYAQLTALIKAVDGGDIGKARELRELIKSRDYLRQIGDMHMQVFSHLVGRLAGDKASMVEFMLARLDEQKAKLGYDEAGELERMMIERIVMCWLRVVEAENYCTKASNGGHSLKLCDYAERSLTRASSRFMKASEALARYRLMIQVTKIATAKADLLEARAAESRTNKSNAAMRLLKTMTG